MPSVDLAGALTDLPCNIQLVLDLAPDTMRCSVVESRADHDAGTVIMADKKKRRETSCQYGRSRTTDEEADPVKCDDHQVTMSLRNSASVSGGGSIVSHLERFSGC